MVLPPPLLKLCREIGIVPDDFSAAELVPILCAGIYQKAEILKSAAMKFQAYGNLIPNPGVCRDECITEARSQKSADPNEVFDSLLPSMR
jgi:hypothetical protein